jgi:hypothetical protein
LISSSGRPGSFERTTTLLVMGPAPAGVVSVTRRGWLPPGWTTFLVRVSATVQPQLVDTFSITRS